MKSELEMIDELRAQGVQVRMVPRVFVRIGSLIGWTDRDNRTGVDTYEEMSVVEAYDKMCVHVEMANRLSDAEVNHG